MDMIQKQETRENGKQKWEAVASGVWKVRFGTPSAYTPTAHRSNEIKTEALSVLSAEQGAEPQLPFGTDAVNIKQTTRGIVVTLPMNTSEDIFGFGLQLQSVNAAGRKRYIKVNSDPKMDTGESHAPVPFYVSTAGYGLFVDTYRYATFYMGTSAEKGASAMKKEVNQPHKEFSESALYAFKRAEEERKVIIEIPSEIGIDLYFFAGDIKTAVQRYNLFSGGGCKVPMWGLGMWYRVYGGSDQEHVKKLASQFREEKMPIDVIGLEPGWNSHSYSCTYEWSNLFPEPQDLIDELTQSNYHINLWEHAFVSPAAKIYDKLVPYSGDYEVWNGLVPDFSMEETCEIFGDWHEKELIDKEITGFKLDECDNSDYNPSCWSFPDSTEFPGGMDGEQMHNAIGLLYQHMLEKVFHKKNIRTFSQVRSSGALAAPMPFVLYSDLYSHKEFIRGMVTSSFSGLLWAPEVRDCANGHDLLRRVQTVCFSDHALLNCWRIPNAPWKQVDIQKNLNNELMEEAQYYTDECRKLFELRMSLVPYLYSAFEEYQKKGLPPVRAVVMEYPQDEAARNLDDEYFFGKDLLVCPLTLEDGTSREIYLPEGTWYNFFTGEKIEGGRRLVLEADWNEMLVFVRDGALVPVAEPVICVTEDTVFNITVKSFGTNKTGSCVLYEDDFVSFNYESLVAKKQINVTVGDNGKFIVSGAKTSTKYHFLNCIVKD